MNQGASHGIGHALGGAAGMSHGETSCVMLPHVLRFNAMVNGSRQQELSNALGWPADNSLAGGLSAYIASLGLPSRLRDCGVAREMLEKIASEAMRSSWVQANPRAFASKEEMLKLLEVAW